MISSLQFYLPVGLIVFCNMLYHICTKSVPGQMNPYFSLIITYLVGAVFAFVLFLFSGAPAGFMGQAKMLNWAPFVLGMCIVGLEAGFIFLYRVGWNISIGSLICSILLALVLIVVGLIFYKESISANQLIGIALCIAGLIFINKQ